MRLSLMILTCIILSVVCAPLLAPHDPMQTDASIPLLSPSLDHPLGTDYLGRDVLSRVLYGGQRTLLVASLAAMSAMLTGLLMGLAAGLAIPAIDGLLTAVINTLLAIPPLVLALVVLTLLGQGMIPLILATGLAQTAGVARVIRTIVHSVRIQGYVLAAQAQGANQWHVIRYHVLPGIRAMLLVYGVVVFSYCLFNSAALSLLGLGGEPGIPDWGVMLADGRNSFRAAPWAALAPGMAITVMIFCLNALVDALNHR